jgi:hypothetical protein
VLYVRLFLPSKATQVTCSNTFRPKQFLVLFVEAIMQREGEEVSHLSTAFIPALKPRPPPIHWFSGARREEREAEHSPLSSATDTYALLE